MCRSSELRKKTNRRHTDWLDIYLCKGRKGWRLTFSSFSHRAPEFVRYCLTAHHQLLAESFYFKSMTSDNSHQIGGPLPRCHCDYPQPPDADLITVAAVVDFGGSVQANAEAQQKQQRQRAAESEATEASAAGKSLWKRFTTFVTNCMTYVGRLCADCCRWIIYIILNRLYIYMRGVSFKARHSLYFKNYLWKKLK